MISSVDAGCCWLGLVVDTVLVVELAVAVLVGGRWGSNIRAEDPTCHMVIVFFRGKCVPHA